MDPTQKPLFPPYLHDKDATTEELSHGRAVAVLQVMLQLMIGLGHLTPDPEEPAPTLLVTGKYDPPTVYWVKRLQTWLPFKAGEECLDGWFGPRTRAALKERCNGFDVDAIPEEVFLEDTQYADKNDVMQDW